jgi:hypothetical protein
MSSLDIYRRLDQHRRARGPGAPISHTSATVVMRGATVVADRLNRARREHREVKAVRNADGTMSVRVQQSDDIKKVAGPAAHNGRQVELDFERHAVEQRQAEDRAAMEQERVGDMLQQALRRLAAIGKELQ